MSGAFISYVHEDSEIVDKMTEVLRWNAVDVWLDRKELLPGVRWKQGIALAIQRGTFFISVHSHARLRRDRSYVNEELTIAIEEVRLRPANKPWLIPVRLDDVEIEPRPIGGGETILDLQFCDLRDWKTGMRDLLLTLGVDRPVLSKPKKMKHRKGFVAPGGSAESALNALLAIQEEYGSKKISRDRANERFGKRTVSDLSVLGLLQADRRDSTVRLIAPHGDQEFALRAAVSSQPAFKLGISELESDIDASATQIGNAVSQGLERDWSDASCMRNGQAIRKWIFLLYPNLKPPNLGGKGFLRLHSYRRGYSGKGAHGLVNAEVLREVASKHQQDLSAVEVSTILGVNPETVRRWKRKNETKWQEIFSDSKDQQKLI